MNKANEILRTADGILDQIFPQIIALRKDLHRHPELAWKEFRTTKKITEFLQKHKIDNLEFPMETGLIADLESGSGNPLIGLRADIDALPIRDSKKTEYHSRQAGVCHACGHDVNTAVMCGTAAVLAALKGKLEVNLRFMFQPAEEPIPSGAPKMIAAGALKDMDHMLGMHLEPDLPLKTISLTPGWVNARSISLEWKISGGGGHSARPHLAADPVWAGTMIVQQAYQLAARKWNRWEFPVILTFTGFTAGESYNVIPREAALTATLRVTDVQDTDKCQKQLQELNDQIQRIAGVGIDFTHKTGAPPVMNDPALVSRLKENMGLFKDFNYRIEPDFRSMGGDDFGWYSQQVPAAMVRFGISTKNFTPALHTGSFDMPEETLRIAVRFFVYQLMNWT